MNFYFDHNGFRWPPFFWKWCFGVYTWLSFEIQKELDRRKITIQDSSEVSYSEWLDFKILVTRGSFGLVISHDINYVTALLTDFISSSDWYNKKVKIIIETSLPRFNVGYLLPFCWHFWWISVVTLSGVVIPLVKQINLKVCWLSRPPFEKILNIFRSYWTNTENFVAMNSFASK